MIKYFYLIILTGILLGLSSCKKESADSKDSVEGTWDLDLSESSQDYLIIDTSKAQEYYISLDVSDGKKSFSANFFKEGEIKGTYTYSNDSLTLFYPPKLLKSDVATTTLLTDSAGVPSVSLTDSLGNEITLGENVHTVSDVSKVIMLKEHGKHHLVMVSGGYKYTVHKREAHSSSFSILSVLRGLLGMAFLVAIAWLFSTNRKAIDWKLVGIGLSFQIVIALLVLKAPIVEDVVDFISGAFVSLISFTDYGINFLFAQMGTDSVQGPLITFAVKILPTIIFFSALMSLLYYWGLLQKIVYFFAWIMKKFMRLSGAESLAAAGNVFLGQTESPLLVKPFLEKMTRSELMCLMTGGMATIAGGVLASYIGFLGGDDPVEKAFFAKHLLTASVISAPAAIVAAKILVPETESINTKLEISKSKIGVNALEAITNGTSDGLKLAVNVGAMLLVFIAMMALANGILGFIGDFTGINAWIIDHTDYDKLSFEFILGYACAPIVWMMGIDSVDVIKVGELLGQKTILNEFVAYPSLGEMKAGNEINEKSIIMSTYMLCGFANIASIGIQIGGIGALAPSRKGVLSQLGVRALIGGTIACMLTAAVVGMTL